MLLRAARPDDAAAIEVVRLAGWRAAYDRILPAQVIAGLRVDPDRVAWRAASIGRPGEVCLVAEDADEIVGAAALLPADQDTAELKLLYVSPERWRSGLGSHLLREGFARMPQPAQVLWVLADNTRARRFYERHGFHADGGSQVLHLGAPVVEVRYQRLRPDAGP